MPWLILIAIGAGLLAIILRRNAAVRIVAAAAAFVFALIAFASDWLASGLGAQLPMTVAALCFLALVVLALLFPGARAEENPAAQPKAPEIFPQLYHEPALEALRAGLNESFGRRGKTDAEAAALFVRLSANLQMLRHLHALCEKMADGDTRAQQEFREQIDGVGGNFPNYQGSALLLKSRAGSQRLESGARPCSVLTGPGMAAVYSGVYATFGPDEKELARAFDVVAGLSLGHGHLEALSSALVHDGPVGLDRAIERGENDGNPYFAPGRKGGWITPPPDDGHQPFPLTDDVYPAPLEGCELVRETCEAMLVDAFTEGALDSAGRATPQRPAAWADNIDRLLAERPCAGGTLLIEGRNFGNGPGDTKLIMSVQGECREVLVDPDKWTDTRIEVTLPAGIGPGPIGFYRPSEITLFRSSTARAVQRAREVAVASACAGSPLDVAPTGGGLRLVEPLTGIPCPPDLLRNVLRTAGAPTILSFEGSAGGTRGEKILLDPDERLSLHWRVSNATRIRLSRTSGNGPLFAGEETIANPPGNVWTFEPTGHKSTGWSFYHLNANNENGCGDVVKTVMVFASKRPHLSIEKFEVTQSIQTESNSVKLVEGKQTVVRVYVRHQLRGFDNLDRLPGVRGRLRVLDENGTDLSGWLNPMNRTSPPVSSPDQIYIDLPQIVDRRQTNDTLNFSLNEANSTGRCRFEVEVFVENFEGTSGFAGYSERVSKRSDLFTFHRRRRLKIKFIPVELVPDPNHILEVSSSFANPPTDDQCSKFILETLKFIPARADVSRLEGWSATISIATIRIVTPFGTFEPDSPIPTGSQSFEFDVQANVLLEWVGLNHDQTDGEIWAILVPSPRWGRAHTGAGEYLTPMTVDSGAHELAHCLNQKHLSLDCSDQLGGGLATGGDTPEEWGEDGGLVVDVAFDVINNNTVSGASELMTYCPMRWTSPKRWQQMFDEVGEE